MFNKKEYQKQYREKNREKLLQQNREYYYKHRDDLLLKAKTSYQINGETIRERNKRYASRNKDKIAERSRTYRQGKGKARRWHRMSQPIHRARRIVRSSKQSAKSRGLAFDIDESDIIKALELGVCQVTGMDLNMTTLDKANPWRPSIDRIDPAKGYVRGNVRIVVWLYNAAKQQYTDGDVLAMAKSLVSIHNEATPCN